MNVAAILARCRIRWMLIGGHYHTSTASFSGPQGPAMLKDIRVNKAFVSAGGVHPKLGVSCANFSEVAMKRAVIENAAEELSVIDRSKLDKVKAAHFADCSDFTAILSERGRVPIGAKRSASKPRSEEPPSRKACCANGGTTLDPWPGGLYLCSRLQNCRFVAVAPDELYPDRHVGARPSGR